MLWFSRGDIQALSLLGSSMAGISKIRLPSLTRSRRPARGLLPVFVDFPDLARQEIRRAFGPQGLQVGGDLLQDGLVELALEGTVKGQGVSVYGVLILLQSIAAVP